MVSRIDNLQKKYPDIPITILIKNDLFFQGVRYTPELGEAGAWTIPNYHPYRFKEGEEDPTGNGFINIPYLIILGDGSLVRILGNGDSPYRIIRNGNQFILMEGDIEITDITFQKKPLWQNKITKNGTPMSTLGISQHGDMLILNPTPGCEYFLSQNEESGQSLRCKFCHYGTPDKRSKALGQEIGKGKINSETLDRIMEVCEQALPEINHFYLVGGSMKDIDEEGKRYLQLAEALQKVNHTNLPVCCGSSSLKHDALLRLRDAGISGVCFNLEIWDKELWKRVCPGKNKFVGYEQWIEGLLNGVSIFGRGNVMSAFVAGMEFTTEIGFNNPEDAMRSSLDGADWLLKHGVIPIYSVSWPPNAPSNEANPLDFMEDYFLRLNIEQYKLRKRNNLSFPNEFVCHRCTYMQLECDFDYYRSMQDSNSTQHTDSLSI